MSIQGKRAAARPRQKRHSAGRTLSSPNGPWAAGRRGLQGACVTMPLCAKVAGRLSKPCVPDRNSAVAGVEIKQIMDCVRYYRDRREEPCRWSRERICLYGFRPGGSELVAQWGQRSHPAMCPGPYGDGEGWPMAGVKSECRNRGWQSESQPWTKCRLGGHHTGTGGREARGAIAGDYCRQDTWSSLSRAAPRAQNAISRVVWTFRSGRHSDVTALLRVPLWRCMPAARSSACVAS